MSTKNRRIKTIFLILAVVLTAMLVIYIHFDKTKQIKKTNSPQLNSTIPVLKNQPCSINDNCNVMDRSSEDKDALDNIKKPFFTEPSMTKTSKQDVITRLEGENIININTFFNVDIHQCKIDLDEESVLEINLLLEQLSYEKPLYNEVHQVNKYLSINVIHSGLPENFIETLAYKLQTLLDIYEQSFGLYLRKQSEINLVILAGQKSYEDFIENLSIYNSNSQGLFWTRTNYAFVAFKDKDQATETALHELVHGINHLLIGMMPRWLNEGLAQLFESMIITKKDRNTSVSLKRPILNNHQPLKLMAFENLLYSEGQWSDLSQRSDLYFTAHYFLSYLFDHQQGINIITKLLREEGKAPCSALATDHYLQSISDSIYEMPFRFDEWLMH